MPVKNILDLKRRLDAFLTKGVLATCNFQSLAEVCADKLADVPGLDHYYLKGGNALTLLQNLTLIQKKPVTGDWDFQAKPAENIYTNWKTNYGSVDNAILLILNGLVENFTSTVDIINVFRSVNDNDICSLTGEISASNNTDQFSIGSADEMTLSYSELLDKIRLQGSVDGGLQLPPGKRIVPLDPSVYKHVGVRPGLATPAVYVNYTIPGFILYRLALRYDYKLKNPSDYYDDPNQTTVTLKSELIDISVPRWGSAEMLMAQDGVLTNFTPWQGQHKTINIPGFGYHLYENINLLQEINLNMSGSIDKKQKRIDRGNQALAAIKSQNPGIEVVKSQVDLKDFPGKSTSFSHGYVSIYLQMLNCEIIKNLITNANDLKLLKADISTMVMNRMPTAEPSLNLTSVEGIARFDSAWLATPKVGEIASWLMSLLNMPASNAPINPSPSTKIVFAKPDEAMKTLQKNSTQFSVLSPLLDLNKDASFPLPFVLVQVKDAKLFDRISTSQAFEKVDGFSVPVKVFRPCIQTQDQRVGSITPLNVRFVFVQQAQPLGISYSIAEYLENALFVSQRKALADSYQSTNPI